MTAGAGLLGLGAVTFGLLNVMSRASEKARQRARREAMTEGPSDDEILGWVRRHGDGEG